MNQKRLISVLLCITVIALTVIPAFAADDGKAFSFIEYPEKAISPFSDEITERISSGDDYLSNRGYDETGLYISPYWTLKVNGTAVPLYAAAVYDWALGTGVIQSFQYIFAENGTDLFINLAFGGKVKNVKVLPEKLGCTAKTDGNTVYTHLNRTGTYTFLINGDSQKYAVTLFVREKKNETEEIKRYKEIYGAENVQVYERGYYEPESIPADKKVIYFKAGSFISAKHLKDVRSADDAQNYPLPAFFDINSKDGMIITGCGTVDFTKLDRQERNLITLNFCKNTVFENLILLNPNSWTVTAYGCENCTVNNITVFGYRTNSDGINICGCNNMTVRDSFCRNGDDCFSVKTTNTVFEAHDISFTGCIGWSNKARCFGITGEVERDIYNITFSDCSVIFRNAVWDNDRVGSLAIAVETGSGNIDNILFENIEIHHDDGRAIYCMVYGEGISDCRVSNVKFRSISFDSDEKIKLSSERTISKKGERSSASAMLLKHIGLDRLKLIKKLIEALEKNYDSTNSISVGFENVCANGHRLRKSDLLIQGNVEYTI